MKIRLKFKFKYAFIGVHWKKECGVSTTGKVEEKLEIWICLIPFFPIYIVKEYKNDSKK